MLNKPVRLSEQELNIIINAFSKYFGHKDKLWLFGSRADQNKKGGDIDLYIECEDSKLENIANQKIDFLVEMKSLMGEQKIDVIINILSKQQNLAIFEIARKTGVRLV